MALPFPSIGEPDMPQTDNAPRFDDLDRLSLGDIAALPAEMLLDLQEAARAETARVKRLRERLEAAIARRYGAAAEAERAAWDKIAGTVRFEDCDIVVVAELPRKVSWDQKRLAEMAERIRAAGDDPTEFLDITYRVPERRFSAWPAALREGFAEARSETTGKPVFRLEPRAR